jgi:ABC-2 type transport system ATP-binding protein
MPDLKKQGKFPDHKSFKEYSGVEGMGVASQSAGSGGIAIVADSLVKIYKNAVDPALNKFSLSVEGGSFFGLLGPNGAGKTTALSIITGLLSPDSGSVAILGMQLDHHLRQIQTRIGLVPQDLALYENLTATENLIFFGKLYGLSGTDLHAEIDRCLEFTQLQDQRDRRVSTFSGGMKRRLNLSAGMLNRPEILFLDEPTVGIDAQSRQLIHERLVELNRQGTTLMYTTHYMEEAQELCSHVGIIDNGRIIHQGRTMDLTHEQGFSNLNDLFFSITGKKLRDV